MSSERAQNFESTLTLTHSAVEWKIPDVFRVQEEMIISPEFECFDAKWRIDLYNWDGHKRCDVVKTGGATSDFYVDLVIGIKRIDGTVCASKTGSVMMEFQDTVADVGPFVRLSKLLRDKMMIAPQGTLVIFCNFSRRKEHVGRIILETRVQTVNADSCQLCKSKLRMDSGHEKIPEQTIRVTHFEIKWKIPDFFSLPEEDKRSPEFEGFGAKWAIDLFYKNGIWKCKIARTQQNCSADSYSGFCAHYIVAVRRIDGTVYKSVCGTVHMTDPTHFGFQGDFLRSCDLLENKLKIASRNTLVVFCSFDLKEELCETVIRNVGIKDENANGSIEAVEDSSHRSDDGEKVSPRLEGVHKLVEDLKGLFVNGTNFDATFKIGDREFRAHRAILAARLPAFEAMFRHDTLERSTGAVEIEDCDPDAFQDFLLFLYSGDLETVSGENFLHLYTLADKYDAQDLKRKCLQFATQALCVDNFCDVVLLALRHGESQLLEIATKFFAKNTKQIISTVKWQCFLKQYPIEANELHLKAIECREHASKN